MELSPLDLGVFIGFIGLVIGVSLYASRREDTTEDYFLAGRNLTWGLVGLSLIASNISTEHFVGMAGLVVFYDNQNYFYLRISHDEQIGKCLGIITSDNGVYDEPLEKDVAINDGTKCFLRAVLDHNKLKFYYSLDGHSFTLIGQDFDATILSDEYCKQGWFTGAFVGLCCQDLSSQKIYADFDFFEVTEL